MTNLEELEKAARKANQALGAAQGKIREAELRPVVGKFFVTTDRYSSGDEWPLYFRVISANSAGLVVDQFAARTGGHFEFIRAWHKYGMDGYQEISRARYNAALRRFLNAIQKRLAP